MPGCLLYTSVIHVDHTYTAEDMMRAGRDVEKNVLSRALYQVLAQRVFVYGNQMCIRDRYTAVYSYRPAGRPDSSLY